MCFNFMVVYPRPPNINTCMTMDSVGDPTAAMCVNSAASEPLNEAITSLIKNATTAAKNATNATAAAAAAASGAGAGANKTQQRPLISLLSVPSLQPFVAAGQLVPRGSAAGDLITSEPYGRACPDMSYGMPQPKAIVLPPQVLQQYAAARPESPAAFAALDATDSG
jgi:hypothetical protein